MKYSFCFWLVAIKLPEISEPIIAYFDRLPKVFRNFRTNHRVRSKLFYKKIAQCSTISGFRPKVGVIFFRGLFVFCYHD